MRNGITKINVAQIIIVLIFIIAFFLWRLFDTTTGAQIILNDIRNDQFFGKVDSVFREKKDHNNQKVKLTTGYIYALYPQWESKVEVGDSLSKRKGSVTVVVFKKNGTKIYFDYNELIKTFKN